MNDSFTHGGAGAGEPDRDQNGFGSLFSGAGFPGGGLGANLGGSLMGAFDELRRTFENRPAPRMQRGDVRTAVLTLLAEEPMHGYQIIREIDERSGGAWKPSAGSVYPTLQLLVDEGMVESEESGGRKVYSLTQTGREAAHAETAESTQTPWEAAGKREGAHRTALAKAGAELAQAVAQVGRSGSAEQVAQAVALLDETRRKVYGILAQG